MSTKNLEYQPLDLTLPEIPERKTLMPQPIGIGTPYMEDICSVLSRAAQKRSITLDTLIYEFCPSTRKFYFYDGKGKPIFRRNCFKKINLLEPTTEPLFKAVAEMPEGINMKMFTTAGLFLREYTDVLRTYRAWCPGCYHDQFKSDHLTYDMLIWSIKCITVCPIHRTRLSIACPYCGAKQRLLSEKYRPGYCFVCRKWLGKKQSLKDYDIGNLRWHKWVFTQIGEIIASLPKLQDVNSPNTYRLTEVCFCELKLLPDNLFAVFSTYFRTFESFLRLFYISGLNFAKLFLNDEYLFYFHPDFLKSVTEALREREQEWLNIFPRAPIEIEDSLYDSKPDEFDIDLFDLLNAYRELNKNDANYAENNVIVP